MIPDLTRLVRTSAGASRLLKRLDPLALAGCLAAASAPTALSQVAPTVTSVTPANGATDVPVTSTLVFRFSQDMNTEVPLVPSVPPFLVGNFEITPEAAQIFDFEWSADKRTLTGTPSGDLPANTTISWRLNPAGSFLPLTSAGGTPLATTSGSFTTGAGGGGGGDEPALLFVSPAEGAMGVPLNANVVFVFDRPMRKITNPGPAIRWIGVEAARFTYAWSGDGATLTCDYAGDFPALATIAWVLNPDGAAVLFESADGVPLPGDTYSGGFMTTTGGGGGGCDPDGIPDAWGGYGISKLGNYVQTSAADPVPDSPDPFVFSAVVLSPDAGPNVTAASVTLPGGGQRMLEAIPFASGFMYADESPATAAALDTAYPAGTYTLRFNQTGQPERVIAMNMPVGNPPIPKIANYTEAQSINASQDFTLRWGAFTGATATDYLSLVIHDNMGHIFFMAPDACVPRPLPVTATSVVLPANTLQSGKTYEGELTFSRLFYFSTNAVANMSGSGSLTRTTRFTLSTGGGTPDAAARFTAFRLLPNSNPELTLTGTAGRSYTIQRTGSLTAPRAWANAGTVTMNAAGTAVFEDVQPGKVLPLYYRAVTQ